MDEILSTGLSAIITKSGKYYGVIDDRHLKTGISSPNKTKCGPLCVHAPYLTNDSTLIEKTNAFLTGHFKALPILGEKEKPIGMITRTDVLLELLESNFIPKTSITDIMNSPVYSLDYKETIGAAKTLMKEKGTSRLLVTKNNHPYGIISTLDLVVSILYQKGRDRKDIISEVKNIDEKPIEELVRGGFVSIDQQMELNNAIKKLVKKGVSSMLVTNNQNAVGVISASDIFKIVQKQAKDRVNIQVSGLSDEEDRYYYETEEPKIEATIQKFTKNFDIQNVHLHIKKGKSIYEFKLNMDVDKKMVSISAEEHSFHDAVSNLLHEINVVLRKKGEEYKRPSQY